MNEAQTIARVSSLARIVARAFVARQTSRVALGLAMVVGVFAVSVTVLAPSLPRAPMLALPLVCLVAALVHARRRVPAEASLVWYVDRRLRADELVLTVYDAASRGQRDPRLVARAEALLARARTRDVRPRMFGREWFAAPFVAALVVLVVLWPRPAPPAPSVARRVRLAAAEELAAVERLIAHADDPAIARATREARALRRALEAGMDARSAVERIERLREQVAAVQRAETPARRRAREAAIEALSAERAMADALASRDLPGLSREIERAAARREAADRARARDALTRAAQAARDEGDDALAESLLARQRLLDARARQAALARELAEAMPELSRGRMGRALETLSRDGDASALDASMVEAMREGWQRLGPEERQRLADAMSQARAARSELSRGAGAPGEQGDARPASADDVERQLRDALANLDRLQVRVGAAGRGLPVPGGERGGAQRAGGAPGEGDGQREGDAPGGGEGRGGPSRGGGPGGTPTGETAVLEVDPLLARVRPLERAGAPSETFIDWVDPAGTGGATTAPVPSSAGVAGEANAVTRARVPEAYREHVRTYFGGGN